MDDTCEIRCLHKDAVKKARQNMPKQNRVEALAGMFKILGDPGRMRILCALAVQDLCVCDLAHLLGNSQSAVSHQLRILRTARLVKPRRQGKVVFYRLDDNHVRGLIELGLSHLRH